LDIFPLSQAVRPYACGHPGYETYYFYVYGERCVPTEAYADANDTCPFCLLTTVLERHIRCAVCGRAILPGDPVTFYHDDPAFRPEWVTAVGASSEAVIGCLREGCCASISYVDGLWDGHAVVNAETDLPGPRPIKAIDSRT